MRSIRAPGMSEHGFEEALQNVFRNSPWWMTSLIVHAVALVIMWNIPVRIKNTGKTKTLVASKPEEIKTPEVQDEVEPPPFIPPEEVDETVILDPTEDDTHSEDEQDSDLLDTFHDSGEVDSPLSGPFTESAIGIGGLAGGGKGGGGGRKEARIRGKYGLTDGHVELGLKWLAGHQDLDGDGRWDSDGFMKHDPQNDRCNGPGGPLYDVGVTSLALLAFLGAGYTDRGDRRDNPYARNVRAALRYLLRTQDDGGCLGSRASKHFMYNHAIGTLALAEAYWMTRNPRYRKPTQDAVNFIVHARNPYLAWRYEPQGGENDTSVTGWMVMALKAGLWAGLEIDPDAFEGARQWIDEMTDPDFGQVGYDQPGGDPARPEGMQDRFPPEKSQAMTAVGMLTRIFLGEDPRKSEMIAKGAGLCAGLPPRWDTGDGSIDMYYWYYGTLAMFQVGGKHWKTWNRAMTRAIVKSQHPRGSGAATGSWDPLGAWGSDGGRVYATATMVLCLEVYYRYGKVFGMTDRK